MNDPLSPFESRPSIARRAPAGARLARRALALAGVVSAASAGCTVDIPDVVPDPCIPGSAIPPNGLVARWSFDLQGNAITDISPEKQTTTVRGSPSPVTGPRVCGAALEFDHPPGASGERIDVADKPSLHITSSMTVVARVRPDSVDAENQSILSKERYSTDQGYRLINGAQGTFTQFYFRIAIPDQKGGTTTCGLIEVVSEEHPTDGRYYLVAGVYDAAAKSLDVYVDGERDSSGLLTNMPGCGQYQKASPGAVPGSQFDSMEQVGVAIGGSTNAYGNNPNDSTFFQGAIDDLLIWTRALSETEIKALGPAR
jgi:hypothetical protein